MTRATSQARAIVLAALFACFASCQPLGPVPIALASRPPVSERDFDPDLPREDSAARAALTSATVPETPDPKPQTMPARAPSLPGSRVVWTPAPPLRAAPAGVGAQLADVESRLPPSMGMQYRDPSRVTWCHETTHGVHAALRIHYGRPAFYPGGGKCALVEAPAITLGDIAAAVPQQLRGTRYNLYLVSQRRQWNDSPLYVWDEWVAYNNGTATGIEEKKRDGPGASDDGIACIEVSGYALAVAAAARRKGVPVSEQFREFLAWELRRSLALYVRAMAVPAFSWPDRRLEQRWRAGDPFVVEELRALYGDALTVRDLLR